MNPAAQRRVLLGPAVCLLFLLGGCLPAHESPVARATVVPTAGISPLVVTFDASESVDTDGFIVQYDWEFGDGATSDGLLVVHPYIAEQDETYVATLTVIDDAGNRDQESFVIHVSAPPKNESSALVAFTWPFHFDAEGDDTTHLNDEYFAIENAGPEAVDLGGWSVENERGLTFVFPAGFTLLPGAIVFVHSGEGTNRSDALFWGAGEPVWNDTSDIATLRDPTGLIIDLYAYYTC